MSPTATDYVEKVAEGGWRIADSRVSLDSVVHAYREGKSPEAIADEFRTLSPERVYGAIAYYLRNKTEIDRYLNEQEGAWRRLAASSESQHGALLNRIRNDRKSGPAESGSAREPLRRVATE
jgi:uncharacterized protein (DUF433 family)